ncbi:MAG TPA: response regulator transcription factor [Opitutaceae bacterium]|nr:response regulator transcription factor [Opitutaceae bacterium]
MKRIRVLLVDDQALFREGLATLLGLNPELELVGEAGNGAAAVEMWARLRPEVVLMDLRMPVMDGVEATRRILAMQPAARILVLTTFEEDAEVFAAVRAGAAGYLLKASPSEKLVEAIRAVAAGESVLQPSVTAKLLAEFNRMAVRTERRAVQPLPEPLSGRELGVLQCLCDGLSNKEIASRLGIAEGTVKNHMTNVLGKLGALDRTQAALRARELGLI